MALVTFRVPPDLAERFAALASRQGGKSVVLRRLIEQATTEADAQPSSGVAARPTVTDGGAGRERAGEGAPDAAAMPAAAAALGPSAKVTLRLREAEMARIAEVAKRRGMNRTQWITCLVRARLSLDLPQTGDERLALRAIARELNRIGGNINQIARAANTEVVRTGRPVPVDAAAIGEAREAVDAASAELRSVLARSAGYWDAPTP
jgi:hypothetical protein